MDAFPICCYSVLGITLSMVIIAWVFGGVNGRGVPMLCEFEKLLMILVPNMGLESIYKMHTTFLVRFIIYNVIK